MSRLPVPTDRDRARYRALIGQINRLARKPDGPVKPLLVAADKAFKAVLPTGYQGAQSPFREMTELARRFGKLSPTAQAEAMPHLAGLARRCADILTQPSNPLARTRADLDN